MRDQRTQAQGQAEQWRLEGIGAAGRALERAAPNPNLAKENEHRLDHMLLGRQ